MNAARLVHAIPVRAHGGLVGLAFALLVLLVMAGIPPALYAPVPTPGHYEGLLGPHGFVKGWRRAEGLSWNVLSETSAHHALVLRVETPDVNRVMTIAPYFVEPVRDRYEEILVYFYRPASGSKLASRRVQWTRTEGYEELVLDPVPRPTQR